ncbi:MAG: hypothetical protein B7Z60_06605 [Ferrovum sp. 37-45-19]|uniref:SPOR domain-containing protein n=1 Tax=Ferrovum sp. JA12 TaxID=1356299 RepID=UPI000702B396|nr:SPOR domain-containing protein [Ferrovum sp. JA12]OYV79372.1 MAG: hypothetical protein B7Z65_06525 [Ferrovum sp. 21-44-67]OYV93989.1 MAG: hypothetical protein B7Z60_06605 [Ferrovum sp. 37-45-19]HQT81823.1 SPOR domain-containing protein [Ferrovaceae bacterium]KRH79376.1 cell division protein FtsN [Ferrovum sp. JA12]HQU06776.1 SPOR domain-containing protein [Ferrovaceae bacterium]
MNPPEIRSRHSRPTGGNGLALFKGVLIGLVAGVILSAVTAIYVTHMPNPFVKKVDSVDTSSDQPINDMPDVSKHGIINPTTVEGSNGSVGALITPLSPQPVVPSSSRAEPNTPITGDNHPVIAPGGAPLEASAPVTENNQLPPPAKKDFTSRSQELSAQVPSSSVFYVQTGAFKEAREAEDQRANLALIGVDASIMAPKSGNEKLYRVRVGPLANMDEVHTLISTLKSNGLNNTVVVK